MVFSVREFSMFTEMGVKIDKGNWEKKIKKREENKKIRSTKAL